MEVFLNLVWEIGLSAALNLAFKSIAYSDAAIQRIRITAIVCSQNTVCFQFTTETISCHVSAFIIFLEGELFLADFIS